MIAFLYGLFKSINQSINQSTNQLKIFTQYPPTHCLCIQFTSSTWFIAVNIRSRIPGSVSSKGHSKWAPVTQFRDLKLFIYRKILQLLACECDFKNLPYVECHVRSRVDIQVYSSENWSFSIVDSPQKLPCAILLQDLSELNVFMLKKRRFLWIEHLTFKMECHLK